MDSHSPTVGEGADTASRLQNTPKPLGDRALPVQAGLLPSGVPCPDMACLGIADPRGHSWHMYELLFPKSEAERSSLAPVAHF